VQGTTSGAGELLVVTFTGEDPGNAPPVWSPLTGWVARVAKDDGLRRSSASFELLLPKAMNTPVGSLTVAPAPQSEITELVALKPL
jgi:hypothetical protein